MEKKTDFKPYISADSVLPEFSVTAIILGCVLAIFFGAANAYLGLRVGMTISASIPAAVISMGIIRLIMKRDSILENNMVQTIGSVGESLAAGAIFTIPAIYMWAKEGFCATPSVITITIICFCGGILGVLFMVPLRNSLIVEEHGVLPFPEGTACAEVLLAGEKGNNKSIFVFLGLAISAVYKFFADGLKLFSSSGTWNIKAQSYKTLVGVDFLPALAGVGYICGPKIAGYIFSGGVLSFFVLIPMIIFFGGSSVSSIGVAFSESSPLQIWSSYARYIGAGAIALGGIISLIKSFPLIVKTFSKAIKGFGKRIENEKRTDKNISTITTLIGSLLIAIILWILPAVPVTFVAALLIVIFGFFFSTVAARIVGLVGSSNSPVSGMTIVTLIVTTLIFKSTGLTGGEGMVAAICVGTVICIIASISGDVSQDLKTGYILGATPKSQQIGEIIGAVVASFAIGGVIFLLNSAWGFGSEELPAPQAALMKMIVEGVMGGNLPWTLILIGAACAIVVEILGIPVMAFAVGLYLPISLSFGIFVGGIVRFIVDRKNKNASEEQKKESESKGLLYSSGLIAGEGIIGILLAIFAVCGLNLDISRIYGSNFESVGKIIGLVLFIALCVSIGFVCLYKKEAKNEQK